MPLTQLILLYYINIWLHLPPIVWLASGLMNTWKQNYNCKFHFGPECDLSLIVSQCLLIKLKSCLKNNLNVVIYEAIYVKFAIVISLLCLYIVASIWCEDVWWHVGCISWYVDMRRMCIFSSYCYGAGFV
jgi:hypothetical protein